MKRIKFVISLVVLVLSTNVRAEGVSSLILSVNKKKSKILVQLKNINQIEVGDILSSGESCTLEVRKKSKNKAILDSSFCGDSQRLQKGMKLQLSREDDQQSSNSKENKTSKGEEEEMVSQGFRFGIYKAFLNSKSVVTERGGDFSTREFDNGEMKHQIGLGVGYAFVRLKSIGVIGNLIYTQFADEVSAVRFELSATYGINKYFYILAGGNVQDFTQGGDYLEVGSGIQTGVGIQISERIGAHVTYLSTINRGYFEETTLEFQTRGVEIALHATF